MDIWPQNIDIWPQNIDIWPQNIDIWPEEFWPPPEGMVPNSGLPRRNGSKFWPPPEGMVPNSGPPPKEWCIEFWPPPEGMVPNFEPKNDLKKGQICVFGSFLGPNGPFRLFSHHILCPTGLMKE